MRHTRTLTTAIISVLGVIALLGAGPASAASHGKAGHHGKQRHRPAPIIRTHIAPAGTPNDALPPGTPTADPGFPPEPSGSARSAPSRGSLLPLPVDVGGTAIAMQTGTWAQGGDDDSCQVDVNNANSWQQSGDELAGAGDKAGAQKAYDNASSIAGEANRQGCTIFLMED